MCSGREFKEFPENMFSGTHCTLRVSMRLGLLPLAEFVREQFRYSRCL